MSDHYRTLGVQPNASKSDIRNAYFRLAHRYHPDHHAQADAAGRAAAAASFRKVKDAYDVLSDDVRRDEYDRIFRTSSFDSGNRRGPYGGAASSSSTYGKSSDWEWSTSFDDESDWESRFGDLASEFESLREALARDLLKDSESPYSKKLRQLREERERREREQRRWNQQGQTSSTRSSSTASGQGGGSRSRPPPRPRPMASGSGTPLFLCW
jgi:curved DNA-binding protein CbpA